MIYISWCNPSILITMRLCPICGRHLCDHTPSERDQTSEEMMSKPTPEEFKVWSTGTQAEKIAFAQKVRENQKKARKKL